MGWLLDVYADADAGLALWLLDESGDRRRLRAAFPVTFYAAGPPDRLRALWRYLRTCPTPVKLSRTHRRDLFQERPLPVLAVEVEQPSLQPSLFQAVSRRFPKLDYYDADLPISLRYAAACQVFPLARCRVEVDGLDRLQEISALDSPWDLDPVPPSLRILYLEPDENPSHAPPSSLNLRFERYTYHLPLAPVRPFLVGLRAILRRHDPDLLLTAWGDTWMLPHLLELAEARGLPLPLNRDPGRGVAYKAAHSYFSYGQVIYRGQQVHLFGRWHIDRYNAMLYGDYGLEGALEMARITALPVQTAARVSPGSGISAMQMYTALRKGILVPWRKQQVERPKTALDLLRADQGGLVYQPLIGLHRDVAEIDFISMYPSIMVHFNISPETVGVEEAHDVPVPRLNCAVDGSRSGLVPETLEPLLKKRVALKARLTELPRWHPRRERYRARASAQKWLLVTCFGYLGYKNARFGRIEAHEAVTAYGREMLLRAKELAEERGFTVLHMYVDGLWVCRSGASQVDDFQDLIDAIAERTRLPVALDGIYRWVAFLPSRVDPRMPVANRYFGVFQDGSLKTRGIEARRRDTPPFIAEVQMTVLERMAQVSEVEQLPQAVPGIVRFLRQRLADLRARRVPLVALLVAQKVSRELDAYRVPSPAARAAAQLIQVGKSVRPGQRVRFLYTRGDPGVRAWDLPEAPDPSTLDLERYREMFVRAASGVLGPLGVSERLLRGWLFNPVAPGEGPLIFQKRLWRQPAAELLVAVGAMKPLPGRRDSSSGRGADDFTLRR
jgi:DNA polymerase-2